MNERITTLETGNDSEYQAATDSHDLMCSDVYDKNDELGQGEMALSSVQDSEMENSAMNTILNDRKESDNTGKNDDGKKSHGNGEGSKIENTGEEKTENLKSLESNPEPEPEPVPTDEYGRELSAYEIMRLERIRRNQAKLAQLGLENASRKMPMEERKKKVKKRASMNNTESCENVGRRLTMSRKSKIKEVNYSDEVKPLQTKKVIEKKVAKTGHKKTSHKRKDQTVPLVIYKEMKHVSRNRRHAVKTAEKNLRYAETEYRFAQRQVDIFDRKVQRRQQKEERRKTQEQAAEENRIIIPVLQEVDRKLWEISMARNQVAIESQRKEIIAKEKENIVNAEIEAARIRFPQLIRESEHALDFLLRKRLRFLKEKKIDTNEVPELQLKKKNDAGEMNKSSNDAPLCRSTKNNIPHGNAAAAAELMPIQSDDLRSKAHEKNKKPKAKNVGGPISHKFSLSLQRKWLEGDDAVAPSAFTQFVPQVGDTILYYPSAHYEFLHEYPDIRCLKGKLLLRKPLWQRAKDESEVGNDCNRKKEKKKWWTQDWISSLQFATGSYPIICRVERTVPEFPYDKEAEEGAKKQKSKKQKLEKGQTVIDDKQVLDGDGKDVDQSRRRSLRRSKPHIGLNVTLRPLTHIIPPTRSKNRCSDKTLFEEDLLSLPPVFSVLTFPSERSQFLIPFSWAYRLSLSLSDGDRVKILGGYSGAIIPNGNHECCITDSTFDFFEDVIRNSAKIELSDSHKLDKFISDSYTKKSDIADCLLPEADLRAAVQVILFQQYKRKAARDEAGIFFQQDTHGPSISCDLSFSAGKIIGGSVSDFIKWIRMTLPRWNGVNILLEHDGTQCETSPWSLKDLGTKKNHSGQNDTLAAALAPSVLISSSTSNNGGILYSIHENLRGKIEQDIKEFIATHTEAAMFVPIVTDKAAPAYSCYVPNAISLRKILNRLKVRQMKFLGEQYQSSSDPTQQQAMENAHCCYYRSIGSILSDLSNVYHNCLLYNNPESDIVLEAEIVTSKVKSLVEKLESCRIKEAKLKDKEVKEAARNAELVACGKEDLTSFPNPSYSTTVEAEAYGVYFDGKLNRDWIQETGSGEKSQVNTHSSSDDRTARLHWTPQCGDKVLYNRQMHGKFVNGHFPSLTKEQRILPHVLPKKNTKMKQTSSPSKESHFSSNNERNGSHYWMLGTVQWIRAVFPSPASNPAEAEVEAFDVASPLLAIGIEFHYNWLSDIYVLYWRPCELIVKCGGSDLKKSSHDDEDVTAAVHTGTSSDSVTNLCTKRRCKQCNLSLDFSFIYPAWEGDNERILPPFPMSLSRVHRPLGLPDKVVSAIECCFNVLKQRCVEKSRIDSFDPKIAVGAFEKLFDLLPPHIQNIVFDSEDEIELPSGEHSEEITNDVLCQVHFLPPWCQDRKEPNMRGISTRTKISSCIRNEDAVEPLHEAIMPFPDLSLDLIQKRLRNKYYRSTLAVAHDIREAFGSSIYYSLTNLTKKSKGRYINEESSKRVLEELIRTYDTVADPMEDRKELKVISSQAEGPINYTCLNAKEKRLLQRLLIVRKLHAAALVSVLETPTVDIAFGLRRKSQFREEYGLCEERKLAMKQADSITASLLPEPISHRARCRTEPLPVVKVRVKVGDLVNSSAVDLSLPIILEPKNYEGNARLISAIFCMPNRKQICARCRMCKYSILTCRVRKAHSNTDFHQWLDYLNGVGGANGLMKLLHPSYVPQIAGFVPTEQSAAVMYGQNPLSPACIRTSSHVLTATTESSPGKVSDCQNMPDFNVGPDQPDEPGTLHGNSDNVFFSNTFNRGSEQETLEHRNNSDVLAINANAANGTDTTLDRDQSSQKTEETQRNLNEVLKKAELALKLARDTLTSATEIMKSKRLLSDEFIRATFHIDPIDGHYLLCIVCGLGGDVLCCETCATVSHYKCVGLLDIPTDDYYCEACSENSEKVIGIGSPNMQNKIELGNATCNDKAFRINEDNDSKGVVLRDLLDELRWNRLKERRDELKIDSCENGKGEVTAAASANEEKSLSKKVDGQQEYKDKLKHSDIDTGKREEKSSINSEKGNEVIETANVITMENVAATVLPSPKLGIAFELGTQIKKEFDKVLYTGTVVALPSRISEYFKVEYEDGDEEDLSENELKGLIDLGEQQGRSTNTVDTSQKFSGILGKPPELSAPTTNNEREKRKRGIPRKNSKQEDSRSVRKRGRPRKKEDTSKIVHQLSMPESNRKRGRGRPRKVLNMMSSENDATKLRRPYTSPQGNAVDEQTIILLPPSPARTILSEVNPEPGFIEHNGNYYCAVENDTCMTIANKLGFESWRDFARVPENRMKYGTALDNVKTRFKKGTLLRIPIKLQTGPSHEVIEIT